MPAISEKIKAALADIEAVRKSLDAVDRDNAELTAVGAALDARRSELAGVEARMARALEEFAKTDAEHSDWRQKAAKEQAAGNARIDQLQEKLQALEKQVAERRAENDNILAGIAALHERLKV